MIEINQKDNTAQEENKIDRSPLQFTRHLKKILKRYTKRLDVPVCQERRRFTITNLTRDSLSGYYK